MNITINTNLKKLRQEKGNTQEDLAEYIGISFQAISKWERGEAFPDITLLPKIAAYYNVSVDDLLGVGKIRQREQIEEYRKRAEKENALKVWQEAIQGFPNDLIVIGAYMHVVPDADEKIRLAERLINESTEEENYTTSALQTLCYTYKDLGDVEQAKKYASQLPPYMVTWSQIMMSLLKGEEAVKHIQHNIISLVDLFYLNVINMIGNGDFSPEENVRICEDTVKLIELVYAGNFGSNYDWTFDLYGKIAENYAKISDLENTLKNLEISADHQIKWVTLPDNQKYTSLFVNRHGYGNPNSTANINWFLDNMQEGVFDFCRDDERFKAIAKKLQEYLK